MLDDCKHGAETQFSIVLRQFHRMRISERSLANIAAKTQSVYGQMRMSSSLLILVSIATKAGCHQS